jgi:hypothetical protein
MQSAGLGWHARRPSAAFAGARSASPGGRPPGTPAIGGDSRLSDFCAEAGAAGFAGWLYAVASPVVAAGDSGSVQVGNAQSVSRGLRVP